ncbi:acetyl-CoA C-acyltransferase, partial [Bacillus thuringiensis]|nr:acetyl-CoA C-acyltransferase [Bacillus thuringiensis]
GYLSGNAELFDPNKESQPGSQPIEDYGRLGMGITAENLADDYGITREEQDQFALESQQKAKQAILDGAFEEEIVPVKVPRIKAGPIVFSVD